MNFVQKIREKNIIDHYQLNRQTIANPKSATSQNKKINVNFIASNSEKRLFSSTDFKKESGDILEQLKRQQKQNEIQRLKKSSNNLFTITENYYTRKNQNFVHPSRIPKPFYSKNRLNTHRVSVEIEDFDLLESASNSQMGRQKKVFFTQNLISDREQSTSSKRQSISNKPIIKKVGSGKEEKDNHSNSSRSISIQYSVGSFANKDKKSNEIIKKKFMDMMKNFIDYDQSSKRLNKFHHQTKLLRQQQKYVDSLFPPVYTSLFLVNSIDKKANQEKHQIKWKRLSEIYLGKKCVIYNVNNLKQINIFSQKRPFTGQFVAKALNLLKNCPKILQKMFEEQQFNTYGLYYVKIFQQDTWKEIILDDYIPVLQTKNGLFQPVFVSVDNKKSIEFPIWPYILEKAYANYYSVYEMLQFGNLIDFMTQLLGLAPIQISLKKKPEKESQNLKNLLSQNNCIGIGEIDKQKHIQIIKRSIKNKEGKVVEQLAYKQLENNDYIPVEHSFLNTIKKIYIYDVQKYKNLVSCSIGKYRFKLNETNIERHQTSLRKIIVSGSSDCIISLQQKQKRFFSKSSLKYSYMWIRILVVQRQYNGYRWVSGLYSNEKSINLSTFITDGEYYIIIMPEWKLTYNFDMTLLIWSQLDCEVRIQKQNGTACEEMIEQSCMDLAQRKGKINQISATLCSYNYVCSETGLIIENINNEKLKEEVKITRNIAGIPSSVEIVPVNPQFYCVQQSDKQKGKFKESIEISIPKLSNFTIVLKMKGGFDKKLIKLFSNDKDGKDI